jgi:catechol 2,3-dioxygenase-like lactoylglutathione lyase family enzyme
MKRTTTAAVIGLLALITVVGTAQAQAPAAPAAPRAPRQPDPPGLITGVVSFGHAVVDLDKSVKFYQGVFGLKLVGEVGRPKADADMQKLTNTPKATYRHAILEMPGAGFTMDLMEFTGIDRKGAATAKRTDPGMSNMILGVANMDAAFAEFHKPGVRLITPGGKVLVQPTRQVIFIADPDGLVSEVIKQNNGQPPAAALSFVTRSRDEKQAFYKDVLGFNLRFTDCGDLPETYGTGVGQACRSQGNVPGTLVGMTNYEYKNLPGQTPFRPRIQDPSSTTITYTVRDMAEAIKALTAAKTPIATTGGAPVMIGGVPNIVVQDPDGLFVHLVEKR